MRHSHRFVEKYNGNMAFGFDRKNDEDSIICYLQKFSDDGLMKKLFPRLSNEELEEIFELLMRLMKGHLTEAEYHKYSFEVTVRGTYHTDADRAVGAATATARSNP